MVQLHRYFVQKAAKKRLACKKTETVKDTKSFTTGTSESFSFGESISVEYSAGFEAFGLGGTVSTGKEKNFGRSYEWKSEKLHEFSKETSITSSHSLTFEGIY